MDKNYGSDLTIGSIPRTLTRFAVPIFIGNLLSSGYSIINTIWVGHLLGGQAVAAVAMTFPIILLMVAFCAGATTATSVMVANFFGAKQHAAIQQVVNTSWSLSGIIAVVFTCLGIAGTDFFLKLLSVPKEIFPMAAGYLRCLFPSMIFMYTSFLVMSSLRAIGNAKTPLLFVVLGTTLNAILDPLLIMGIGPFPCLGINGAAIASLVSGAISAISGFIYLKFKYQKSPLYPRQLALDKNIIRQIIKIGFPAFVQQSLFSFAIGFMTALVNGFGATAAAVFGIAGRIDMIVALPAMAVMAAVSTVTAQNLGAGKPERIRQVFHWGLLINTPFILLVAFICFCFPAAIMQLFVKDPEIIRLGIDYFRIMVIGYLFLIPPYVSNGIIAGSGKTMVTMIMSFVSLCLVRIPLAIWLSHTRLGLNGLWVATALSFPVNAGLGYWYYLSGHWKKSTVVNATAIAEEMANTQVIVD